MRCNSFDHYVSYEDFKNQTASYTGEYKIISSTGEAILVEKKYRAECPHCQKRSASSGHIIYKNLELIPTDVVDTTQEV